MVGVAVHLSAGESGKHAKFIWAAYVSWESPKGGTFSLTLRCERGSVFETGVSQSFR